MWPLLLLICGMALIPFVPKHEVDSPDLMVIFGKDVVEGCTGNLTTIYSSDLIDEPFISGSREIVQKEVFKSGFHLKGDKIPVKSTRVRKGRLLKSLLIHNYKNDITLFLNGHISNIIVKFANGVSGPAKTYWNGSPKPTVYFGIGDGTLTWTNATQYGFYHNVSQYQIDCPYFKIASPIHTVLLGNPTNCSLSKDSRTLHVFMDKNGKIAETGARTAGIKVPIYSDMKQIDLRKLLWDQTLFYKRDVWRELNNRQYDDVCGKSGSCYQRYITPETPYPKGIFAYMDHMYGDDTQSQNLKKHNTWFDITQPMFYCKQMMELDTGETEVTSFEIHSANFKLPKDEETP